MNIEEIKKRVRQEIIEVEFPDLVDVEPQVRSAPAESQLRALRRSRAVLSDDDVKAIPVEVQLTYHLPENDEMPFDKTVVVVTNDKGEKHFVIESK